MTIDWFLYIVTLWVVLSIVLFLVDVCWDWIYDNGNEVCISRWLVLSFNCIWVQKVMIMELHIVFVVEMLVILSKTSEIVFNVEVFVLIEVTFMINVIESFNRSRVLRRSIVLNSGVLNSWLNLE